MDERYDSYADCMMVNVRSPASTLMIPCLFIFFQRYFINGLTAGALRG